MNKYLEKIANSEALDIVMDLTHKHFDPSMKPNNAFFPKNQEVKSAYRVKAHTLVEHIEKRFGKKISPGDHAKLTTPRKVADYFKNDTP